MKASPDGLSLDGRTRLFGVQWHIQDDSQTVSQLKRQALADLPNVLRRHGVEQHSMARFEVRLGEGGESFLEALLDVRTRDAR